MEFWFTVDVRDLLDKFTNVVTGDRVNFTSIVRLGRVPLRHGTGSKGKRRGLLVVTLFFDVLVDIQPSIDELLLWQEGLKDSFSVSKVNPMQVLRLDFLLSLDLDAVKHAQLRDVEQYLEPVQLLVHDRVEAELEFGEQGKLLDEAELADLVDHV